MAYIPPQLQIDTESENRRIGFLNQAMQGFGEIAKSRQAAIEKEKADKRQSEQDKMTGESHSAKMEEVKYQKDQRALAPEERDSFLEAKGIARLKQETDFSNFEKQEAVRHRNNKDLLGAKADSVAATKGPALSKGEETVDKKYADKYVGQSGSGFVNSEFTIKKLEDLQKEMEADQGFGEAGGTSLPLPDMFRSTTAIRRRDETRNAANSTLKELFGGALSDSEREAAANEYYNDKLPNKENAKILKDKITQLKAQRSSEIDRAKYFEKNRTLKGYSAKPSRIDETAPFKQEHVDAVKGMSDEQLLQIINGQ